MRVRFRYLRSNGREVEVESFERMRALVSSGTVGELTLLYDALTREWAPARAHAAYRLLREEAHPPPASTTLAPDFGPSLSFQAPPESVSDSDEAIRTLLKERDREDHRPAGILPFGSPDRSAPAEAPPSPGPSSSGAIPPRQVLAGPTSSSPPSRADRPSISARPAPPPPVRPAPPPVQPQPLHPSQPSLRPPEAEPPGSSDTESDRAPRATLASSVPASAHVIPLDRVQAWLIRGGEWIQRVVDHRALPPTMVAAGIVGLLALLFAVVRMSDAAISEPGSDPSAA